MCLHCDAQLAAACSCTNTAGCWKQLLHTCAHCAHISVTQGTYTSGRRMAAAQAVTALGNGQGVGCNIQCSAPLLCNDGTGHGALISPLTHQHLQYR
jgi:hypothetical protein